MIIVALVATMLTMIAPGVTPAAFGALGDFDDPYPPTGTRQNIPAQGTCGPGGAGEYVKFTTGGNDADQELATSVANDFVVLYSFDTTTGLFRIDSVTAADGTPILVSEAVGKQSDTTVFWDWSTLGPLTNSSPWLTTGDNDANFTQFSLCIYPHVATLNVAKVVVPAAEGTFTFDVVCTLDDNGTPVEIAVYEDVTVTTDASGEGSVEVADNLPVGTTCTVTEDPLDEYTNDGPATVTLDEADETYTATITNTRITTTITLAKQWSGPEVATDTTTLHISDLATSTTAHNPDQIEAEVDSGTTVSLSEVLDASNTAGYVASIACTDAAGDEVTVTSTGDFSGTIVADGDSIACTITNTRQSATFTLAKDWIDGESGDTAALTAVGDAADDAATYPDIDFVSTATIDDSRSMTIWAGESVQFGETVDTAKYNSTYSCGTADPVDGTAGTYDVPAEPVDVTCTITNELKKANLALQKEWVDALAGETAALSIGGGAMNATTATSTAGDGIDTANVATAQAMAGATIDFGETLTNDPNYDTTFACTGATNEPTATTGVSSSLDIAPGDAGNDITCTFTNTRKSNTLTLDKQWGANSVPEDQVTLSIVGENTDQGASSADGTIDDPATITFYAGETVSLSEVSGVDNVALYDVTALTCSAGDLVWVDGQTTATLALDGAAADGEPVECTFTNTRKSAELTVNKTWPASVGAVDADFTATGINTIATTATSPDDTDDATNTMTIFSGEEIAISEVIEAGEADNYTSSLSCDQSGLVAGTDGRSGTYTVPGDPADVTCTFTNTVKTAGISLTKVWVDALAGDQASLELADGVQDSATAVSTAGESTTVTLDVAAGQTATFTEALAADVADNYSTEFVCSGNTNEPVVDADQRGATLLVDPADDGVACTMTNTRKSTTLTLHKTWVPGSQIDDSVTLTIQGENRDDGLSVVGGLVDPASTTVYAGETVTLSEVLSAANVAGYTVTDFTCTVDGFSWGGAIDDFTATLDIAPADTAEAIACTFTNTQKATLVIIKDAQADDPQDFVFSTNIADDFVLDDDADATLPNTWISEMILAGETVTVSEAGVFGWVHDVEASTCTGADDDVWAFADGELELTMPAGARVTCTFVNVAQPASVELVKLVENDHAENTAVATDWTLSIDGSPVSTMLWDDAPDGSDSAASGTVDLVAGTYVLAESIGPRAYVNTSLTCLDTDTGAAVPVGEAGEVTVGHGQQVQCTFVNDDAQLTVVKTSLGEEEGVGWYDNDLSGGLSANDQVAFVITGLNTGDVTLTNVVLSDPQIGESSMACGDLAPGEACIWGSQAAPLLLELTQADIDAQSVTNVAFGTSDQDDDDDEEEVTYEPLAEMESTKTFTGCNPQIDCEDGVQVGDTVTFDIRVDNIGAMTLLDVFVDDPLTGDTGDDALLCAATLAPGSFCVVSVEYTATQADLDAGDTIENVAVVTATPNPGPGEPGEPITQEPGSQAPIDPEPSLTLDKSVSPALINDAEPGDEATFTFVVTNTGNIVLEDVGIVDDMIADPIECESTVLAPGESTTCSAAYSLTAADIANGSVNNVAMSTGTSPRLDSPVESPVDDATIVFTSSPPPPVAPRELPEAPTPTPTPEPEDEVLELTVLAMTGGNSHHLAAAALTLIAAGLSFLYGGERRRRDEESN